MMEGVYTVDKHILLSEQQMQQSLGCFYREVAEMAGYKENEDTLYDCRKILIASNVQEAIIRYYETMQPEISREQVIILLAISGPKVDFALKENEIVLQPGFVGNKKSA